jgi:hypothetical protein
MPQVGFEPMTPVFERAKTVHVLDRAATIISFSLILATVVRANFVTLKEAQIKFSFS